MPEDEEAPLRRDDPWAGVVDEASRNTIREELNGLMEKEGEGGVVQNHRYPQPVEDWLKCVDQTSWNNREWGVGLWHVLTGLVLRDLHIPAGGDYLDGRAHVLILGPSRCGKSRSVNVAQIVLETFNKSPLVLSDVGRERFPVYSLTEATTAGLIGTAQSRVTREGKTSTQTKEFVPGLLGKAGLLRWDEAETMFHETPYNVNMLRALNQAMNPIGSPGNRVNKMLAGLDEPGGVSPKCALATTAVDFLSIPEGVLRSGFLQRNLIFWKDLTIDDRRANSDVRRKLALRESATQAPAADSAGVAAAVELLQRFWGMAPGIRRVEFEPRVDAGVEVYYQRWLNYTALMDPVMRLAFTDFVEGAVDKLRVLATHYAVLRSDGGSRVVVTRDDLEHSKSVVSTSLLQLAGYLKTVSYAWREMRARQAARERARTQ